MKPAIGRLVGFADAPNVLNHLIGAQIVFIHPGHIADQPDDGGLIALAVVDLNALAFNVLNQGFYLVLLRPILQNNNQCLPLLAILPYCSNKKDSPETSELPVFPKSAYAF